MNRELWGDDDIFVAVDVYAVDNPKKRILCVPYAPPLLSYRTLYQMTRSHCPPFARLIAFNIRVCNSMHCPLCTHVEAVLLRISTKVSVSNLVSAFGVFVFDSAPLYGHLC